MSPGELIAMISLVPNIVSVYGYPNMRFMCPVPLCDMMRPIQLSLQDMLLRYFKKYNPNLEALYGLQS